jgi:hypothetical protein
MKSQKFATARHCRRVPASVYPAIRDGWPARQKRDSSDNFKYRSSRRHNHWHHVWLRSHRAGTDSAHQYRGNLPSGRSCDGWPDRREHNRTDRNARLDSEQKAREQIIKDQATYSSADKRRCMRTSVYLPSYVTLRALYPSAPRPRGAPDSRRRCATARREDQCRSADRLVHEQILRLINRRRIDLRPRDDRENGHRCRNSHAEDKCKPR